MFEELYEPLPDRSLYWERIGMPEPKPEDPRDVELLDKMIFAHQCAIPFENLDIYDRHINVPLGIPDVFDKIVRGARGGYCFELNALFHALLQETGYDVMPCVGRSLKNRGYVYPFTHRGIIVTIDGQRRFCDVGYGGPMPSCSIPLVDGCQVTSHGQSFRIERGRGNWWTILYLGSARKPGEGGAEAAGLGVLAVEAQREPVPVTAILNEPMQLTDYLVLSHFCSTSPHSVFTQWRMVNRRTEEGNVSITDNRFTRVGPQGKETIDIVSEEHLAQLLKEEFGIVL